MRDLKADLELCERATPAPWKHDDRSGCTAVRTGEAPGLHKDDDDVICFSSKSATYNGTYWTMDEQVRKDFAFIAAAREGWPEAIRRAMAAEAQAKEVAAAIHAECRQCGLPGNPATCPYDDCPLWPHRPGANREEMERC